jgi:hypothetical protein
MGNHHKPQAEFQAYIEDESTGSSLTDFPESRGTQSTRDDFEGRENEPESSSDGHDISPTESNEIVFFDEMEGDAPEDSLFGSKSVVLTAVTLTRRLTLAPNTFSSGGSCDTISNK